MAFKVQAYQNSTISLALSVTAGGDSSASELISELNRAVSSYVINNPATSYAMKGLDYMPENSNSSTQTQSNYLK